QLRFGPASSPGGTSVGATDWSIGTERSLRLIGQVRACAARSKRLRSHFTPLACSELHRTAPSSPRSAEDRWAEITLPRLTSRVRIPSPALSKLLRSLRFRR